MIADLQLSVPGMTCDHCVSAVRGEVAAVRGVIEVSVDLDSKAVVVTGDDVSAQSVADAVEEAGYVAVF